MQVTKQAKKRLQKSRGMYISYLIEIRRAADEQLSTNPLNSNCRYIYKYTTALLAKIYPLTCKLKTF